MPRKKLTDTAVKNLKATGRRYEVMDALVSGFGVRVSEAGRRTFILKTRFPETRINPKTGYPNPTRRALGEYPAMSLEAARAKAGQWLMLIGQGDDPARVERDLQQAEAMDRANSFEAVARDFVVRYLAPKNRSWKESARQLGLVPDPEHPDDPKRFVVAKGGLVQRWGDRKLGDIRKADIIAVLDETIDRGATIMANRVLAVLRKMFNWAVGRDLIAASPCAGVQAPTSERARDRVLTDDELRAVWDATDGFGYPFGFAARLLILTGQRRDEVGGMRWSEIDLDGATWALPRGRVKNDSGHVVPLGGDAIAILRELPRVEGRDFVFSTTGKSAVSGWSHFKAALDQASGVTDWRLHDIRRTVASGLARLGVNLPVIEKVLNHRSGTFRGIVGVYQRHDFADQKRVALEAWGRCVKAIVEGQPAAKAIEMTRANA